MHAQSADVVKQHCQESLLTGTALPPCCCSAAGPCCCRARSCLRCGHASSACAGARAPRSRPRRPGGRWRASRCAQRRSVRSVAGVGERWRDRGQCRARQVLDFGQVVAGNMCGMLLAYFGAKVIKARRPGLAAAVPAPVLLPLSSSRAARPRAGGVAARRRAPQPQADRRDRDVAVVALVCVRRRCARATRPAPLPPVTAGNTAGCCAGPQPPVRHARPAHRGGPRPGARPDALERAQLLELLELGRAQRTQGSRVRRAGAAAGAEGGCADRELPAGRDGEVGPRARGGSLSLLLQGLAGLKYRQK